MNKGNRQSLGKEHSAYSASGYSLGPLGNQRIDELAAGLTQEERRILLEEGTECALTGPLVKNKKDGLYVCRLCGLPLYGSGAKFESGTGWPSFFRPFDPAHVLEKRDTKLGTVRTDHSTFDKILRTDDRDGGIDYDNIRRQHLDQLGGCLEQLAGTDVKALPHSEQLMFHINLHNPTVTNAVAERLEQAYSVSAGVSARRLRSS